MKSIKQQGFLLPAAIFILVILAALGAYALNITSVQQNTSMQDTQGTKAYQAARAGVEWAAYQVLNPGSTALVNCPASPTALSIDNFLVSVTCGRSADYNEQGTDHTIAMYDISATASFGAVGTANYIQRQIQLTVSKCLGTDEVPNYQCN
jgi:MSHA biogenesis protein MshP